MLRALKGLAKILSLGQCGSESAVMLVDRAGAPAIIETLQGHANEKVSKAAVKIHERYFDGAAAAAALAAAEAAVAAEDKRQQRAAAERQRRKSAEQKAKAKADQETAARRRLAAQEVAAHAYRARQAIEAERQGRGQRTGTEARARAAVGPEQASRESLVAVAEELGLPPNDARVMVGPLVAELMDRESLLICEPADIAEFGLPKGIFLKLNSWIRNTNAAGESGPDHGPEPRLKEAPDTAPEIVVARPRAPSPPIAAREEQQWPRSAQKTPTRRARTKIEKVVTSGRGQEMWARGGTVR